MMKGAVREQGFANRARDFGQIAVGPEKLR